MKKMPVLPSQDLPEVFLARASRMIEHTTTCHEGSYCYNCASLARVLMLAAEHSRCDPQRSIDLAGIPTWAIGATRKLHERVFSIVARFLTAVEVSGYRRGQETLETERRRVATLREALTACIDAMTCDERKAKANALVVAQDALRSTIS